MAVFTKHDPVTVLSGVGPARAKALAALRIETVGDLINHLPRGYQNRALGVRLADVCDGQTVSLALTIGTQVKTVMLKRRLTLSRCRAFDESATCTVTFFSQPYIKDTLEVGKEYRFYGKVKRQKNQIELVSPIVEELRPDLADLVAVYPLTKGLSSKILSALVSQALTGCDLRCDPLPDFVRTAHDLPSLEEALWQLHFPDDPQSLARAQKRMMMQELFFFSLCIASQNRRRNSGQAKDLSPTDSQTADFLKALPYQPTGAQLRAISQIAQDLRAQNGVPMSRLLNGDVGSGKTLCAAAGAYFALLHGSQCAIMAPTEILAMQHFQSLQPMFEAFGFQTVLLCASMKAQEKRAVLSQIQSGQAHLVIGTHALLTDTVTFSNLGLVITDEQHRFGVFQRTALTEKGHDPHLLVMSATPIPRTLALILYGDLALSTLDEMPPGRQKVDTFFVDESYRARLNQFIAKQAGQGKQVYIVCPAIEKADDRIEEHSDFSYIGALTVPDMKNVTDYTKELQKALPDLQIEALHGKLSGAKKEEIMRRFVAGQTQVLVSTTVIEVGVNVPNATLMIVENAERFGLSQLHQLRGRVGRGDAKSFCVLVSDAKDSLAAERLRALCECCDGYEIAKRDLAMRGPGDFFPDAGAARQSGQPIFRFASLCDDMQLLEAASQSAKELLLRDPSLQSYPDTRAEVAHLLQKKRNTVH